VGGIDRTYVLVPGETRIGSITGNGIVLPVRGVSRQHALLRLGETLLVEDLGSRNGILVNGVRVQRTELNAGDEVCLGPVKLHLEALDAADTQLAIVLPVPEPAHVPGLPADESTAVAREGGADDRLRVVESFIDRLCAPPSGDLAGALGRLARDIGAEGAAVVEWPAPGREPVVLAASGRFADLTAREDVGGFVRKALRLAKPAFAWDSFSGEPRLTCAALQRAGADPIGLLLWGDYRRREESEPLLRVLLRLLDRFRPRAPASTDEGPTMSVRGLVFPPGYVPGDSPAMAQLYRQMQPLVDGDLPVLILGETGVGKEYMARMLHASSPRRDKPFVAVNCAAIPADLLEAEMFGIGKGIATGVVERQGKFQLAQSGTLFLDEIGDMSAGLQAKLLRALQEKEVHPVGGGSVPVDIRVLTATNTDLDRRMEDGTFRRDLYYRVAGFVLRMPPLRERREDIPALVEGFIRNFSRGSGKMVRGMTAKALRALVEYDWPGNVRELEHEVRKLVYLCPAGQAIDSAMLSERIVLAPAEPPALPPPRSRSDRARGGAPEFTSGAPDETSLDLEARVQTLEARLIREALSRSGGNRTQAAKLLGVSRNGLAIKMSRLGIES
jgi:DNA-binding NtrC family response regulator